MPGHRGVSSDGFANLTSFIDYVEGFIDHLNLKEFSLLGFSFGGVVATALANRFRKRGKDVPCVVWASPLDKRQIKLRVKLILLAMKLLPVVITKRFLKTPRIVEIGRVIGIKLGKEAREALKQIDSKVLKRVHDVMYSREDLNPAANCLLIHDREDVFVKSPEEAPNGCRLKIIDGSGHFGTSQARRKVVEEIDRFLQKKKT
jgi:pimeloyl-ACP methyl ester carboxylesterase